MPGTAGGVMMERTCVQCGQCADVGKWRELAELGWTLDALGDCVCVSCTRRQWPAKTQPRRDAITPVRGAAGATPRTPLPSARKHVPRAHPHLVLVKQLARTQSGHIGENAK